MSVSAVISVKHGGMKVSAAQTSTGETSIIHADVSGRKTEVVASPSGGRGQPQPIEVDRLGQKVGGS